MAGNNRFIRVENLFDKIHVYNTQSEHIHTHFTSVKSMAVQAKPFWPSFSSSLKATTATAAVITTAACVIRCTFCHAKLKCSDFSSSYTLIHPLRFEHFTGILPIPLFSSAVGQTLFVIQCVCVCGNRLFCHHWCCVVIRSCSITMVCFCNHLKSMFV